MKNIKVMALAIVSCASLPAFSNVELISDNNLDLLVVNGKKANVESSLLSSSQKITLPNGENQITFRYSYAYRRGDNYERVDTPIIIAKFRAQDSTLNVQFPTFRNVSQAEKNVDAIEWSLIDQGTNQAIAFSEDKLVTKGLQLGRDFVRETQDYNLTAGVAAINSMAGKNRIAAPNPDIVPESDTVEEMLYFWYDKASPELKSKFKAYINQ